MKLRVLGSWTLAVALAACGDGDGSSRPADATIGVIADAVVGNSPDARMSGPADAAVDAASLPPSDAAPTCTMTIVGASDAAGPCAVFVTPHGLDANGPALIGIRWTTHPASSIDIRDFCAGSLAPPRSELISETTDGCVDWTGTVDDGTNSWTLSTFMVSYDPGFINQREQFPDAHGTIDATLTGATGTVTLHVTFSTSM